MVFTLGGNKLACTLAKRSFYVARKTDDIGSKYDWCSNLLLKSGYLHRKYAGLIACVCRYFCHTLCNPINIRQITKSAEHQSFEQLEIDSKPASGKLNLLSLR